MKTPEQLAAKQLEQEARQREGLALRARIEAEQREKAEANAVAKAAAKAEFDARQHEKDLAKAAAQAKAAARQREKDAARAAEEAAAKEKADFLATERRLKPTGPGRAAHTAFERGDHVFQYTVDVMTQTAISYKLMGSTPDNRRDVDPVDTLNDICRQGWDLVNASFAYVQHGQQRRDSHTSSKDMHHSGSGTTVAYYVFRRSDGDRVASGRA